MVELNGTIVPAIIAHSRGELDAMLDKVRGKVKRVQLDVMDGVFVQNMSLMFEFKLPSGLEYEAHLMVDNPLSWVGGSAANVSTAILHVEALKNISEAIKHVKTRGLSAYLTLKPATSIDTILPYLGEIDGIQVMTVDPGRYSGEFLFEPLEKIDRVREASKTILIEVDGGMNPESVRLAKKHGANVFVSGSYILKSANIDEALRQLRQAAEQCE